MPLLFVHSRWLELTPIVELKERMTHPTPNNLVLIVDSNPHWTQGIRGVLQESGYSTIVVRNLIAAAPLLLCFKPCLFVLSLDEDTVELLPLLDMLDSRELGCALVLLEDGRLRAHSREQTPLVPYGPSMACTSHPETVARFLVDVIRGTSKPRSPDTLPACPVAKQSLRPFDRAK